LTEISVCKIKTANHSKILDYELKPW